MLPRVNRLTLKSDFQKVLKAKNFLHSKYFALSSVQDNNKSPQLGIIVSNKVSKKATERNRIKRIIREAARNYINNWSCGLKVVVLTKTSASTIESKILTADIENVFKKLK